MQINGFGNIEKKEIEFKEKINLIYGKNESGKSTLLKCITNLFYGSSKNKKGKEISDFEKYKPWKADEFSAKISYALDDGSYYEVYRDFTKKNPKIYNKSAEEISNQYAIDKTKGNQFFVEQTGIEEETFLASLAVMQQEVKLGKTEQNSMVQKIANLTATGEDYTSFQSAINRLNKKLLEEVGTSRSQGRPYNKVVERQESVLREKRQLDEIKEDQYTVEEQKEVLINQEKQCEKKLEMLEEWEKIVQQNALWQEKQKVEQDIIEKQEIQLEDLKKELEEKKKESLANPKKPVKKKKTYFCFILAFLLLAGTIASFVITSFGLWTILLLVAFIIVTMIDMIQKVTSSNKRKKQEKTLQEEKQKQVLEVRKLEGQIEVVEHNIQEQVTQLEQKKAKWWDDKKQQEEALKRRFQGQDEIEQILSWKEQELQQEETRLRQEKNQIALAKQRLEIEEKERLERLEKLASLEEEIGEIEEEKKNLEEKAQSIQIAKEAMEKAYQIMQETITPKFTEELSKAIGIISKGKYHKVKLTNQDGLVVELPTGEYISVDLLSTGTIDQLYLALRLAILKEMTKENMPIILDESFAYYDQERLENILSYLQEQVENQVLILTCTNREEEIMKQKEIPYHKIIL